MGFTEIYLVGYDLPPGGLMPHFYSDSDDETDIRRQIMKKTDLYSITEMHWQYFRCQVENYYMSAYANKHGVRIFNCSESSYVHAFEKAQT